MKQHFDTVVKRMLEQLPGYELREQDMDGEKTLYAIMASEKELVKLEYSYTDKLFVLYRGESDDAESLTRSQTYLFDEQAGDGTREANGVANEFVDTLGGAAGAGIAAPAAKPQKKKNRNQDTDESTAEFFVNRIPSVMPECREPLLQHKSHYGKLLPRFFCEEVVTVAMRDMLKSSGARSGKSRTFFELLNNLYLKGDLDTKAIIMQVLMPVLEDERDIADVREMVSKEFKEGWDAGKRYFGKNVKPEKISAMAKVAQHQAETLKEMQR